MNGHYFDLNQTTLAYRLGGKDTHWVDYTINDNEGDEEKYYHDFDNWDEERYYNDFDNWWDSLSEEERETISNLINLIK